MPGEKTISALRHYGDPCVHCGVAHDDVPPGPCQGDRSKTVVMAYCIERQSHQNPGSGCDTILCLMSDGNLQIDARHPSEWWWISDWFKRARACSRQEFSDLISKRNLGGSDAD